MISEVDKALRDIIALKVPNTPVRFEAPSKEWAEQIGGAQTINVFLYDLREAVAGTSVGGYRLNQTPNGWLTADSVGQATHTIDPPRWYTLSYMVTAWYQDPGDMHRVLEDLLIALTTKLTLDIPFSDVLKPLSPVAEVVVAAPPDNRTVSELWSALGNRPLPNVNLAVTLPLDRWRTDGPTAIGGERVKQVVVTASELRTP
ncbi:DUF4255 domain-containing protein [Catenulispora yoronensis]|uniref:DUF4255 domain-containing protein n=1 Tax=Catenulispora yoronensis TaxID=450799 RepID=A0ABN2TLZ9_9ACTN